MNRKEENRAKEFYIGSVFEGIHTESTDRVEMNYYCMIDLMHSYAVEQNKTPDTKGLEQLLINYTTEYLKVQNTDNRQARGLQTSMTEIRKTLDAINGKQLGDEQN